MFIASVAIIFALQLLVYRLVTGYIAKRNHIRNRRLHVLHTARNGYPEQVQPARNKLGVN